MATYWTPWEYFDSGYSVLQDPGPEWNQLSNVLDPPDPDNSKTCFTDVFTGSIGQTSERLILRLRDTMFTGQSWSTSHRLRAVEFRCWFRSNVFPTGPTESNKLELKCYWAGPQYIADTVAPASNVAFDTFTANLTLAQWGFDTTNDGVNAMQQFLGWQVDIRLRGERVGSGEEHLLEIHYPEARVQYEDPAPKKPGLLVGIL